MLDTIALLAHLAATLAFVGIVWYAHIDQYPLLRLIGKEELPAYEREYYRRTMPWAIALLAIEAGSGVALLWLLPAGVPIYLLWIDLALLAGIHALTWEGCVRCHLAMRCGIEGDPIEKLLRVNLPRAVLWSLRGVAVLAMAAMAMQA